MLISNGRKVKGGFKIIWVAKGMESLSLDLVQAAKSSAVRECLEFLIPGWFKMKIVWLYSVNVE